MTRRDGDGSRTSRKADVLVSSRAASRILLRLAVVLLLAALPADLPALETLPFSELEVGMNGVGRTIFHGDRIEEFKIEIVALLEDIQPRRNLILVRCSGGAFDRTGVAQGMSGSPIYVRGKLIGALAYSWGFSREAVAGVTPIEEMLAIPEEGRPRAEGAAAVPLQLPPGPEAVAGFLDSLGRRPRGMGLARPLALPVYTSGFPDAVLSRLGSAMGAELIPTGNAAAGSSGDDEAGATAPLEAGSALGVQLVRGDLELTAIGTVTAVEGSSVLAFGHPFLNMGPTAMPMTGARVHLIVPSLESSFKIASPTGELGTVQEDRAVGLRGTLGRIATMVPVRIELAREQGSVNFEFDLVDDPLLTPLLLNYAVLSVVTSEERSFGPLTLQAREGSRIRIEDHEPVRLDNFYSGDFAAPFAAGLPAYLLYVLMNNEYVTPRIEGIDLLFDLVPERRSARIAEVWADRERVKAGEEVQLHVTVRPFREDPTQATLQLTIPPETPTGRLVVRVGDGLTLGRLETEGEPSGYVPRDLDQLIWLMNQIRSFNRVYANVSVLDEGLVVGGMALPNLPPSVAQVLQMPQAGGNFLRRTQRGLLEESTATPYAVSGYRKLFLEVVP